VLVFYEICVGFIVQCAGNVKMASNINDDDVLASGEIDEFAMFQARSLGAESEYLLLKQASRHHHQGSSVAPRSSPRAAAGAVYSSSA